MGCCEKAVAIVQGWTNVVSGKQYAATPRRRITCRKCALKKKIWGVGTWCTRCKCYIEAKIRAKAKTCDKWLK